MIGSFLSRTLLMIFGYAYPAYECFKVAENNRTDIVQVLFWCRYWILVAMLTVCERVGDHLIFWLPMYSEAKLAFFIYLWHPKTKGTEYVYDCFFRPFVAKHETEIDRNLLEMRVQAKEIALIYWQKAAAYGQTKFFEILQGVSSQSASMPRSDQQQDELNAKNGEPKASSSISEATTEKQPKEPDQLHSSSSASLSQQSHEPASELEEQPGVPMQSLEDGDINSPRQETVPKESVQLKHGRWKLFQSPQKPSNS
ncbi:PREDICTED: putative HVA22-like protein g isoform X1 [Populus euphratica]|uniref:HVA22-like protein n=2 Tax=Populus euphratica TaxID=75702 RepID=A0AAJ6UXP1_POPEU|nr:PREDICTED: putative HVA22-like protein g isoform X1 [Populus euphratica]